MRTSFTRRNRGFTLIELMVAVAVVAILAAIAYPSYLESVRKSRRAEAKTSLLDLAARQERYFATHNAYATTPAALGYGAAAFPVEVRYGDQAHYHLDVTVLPDLVSWTASASPAGSQAKDRCGTYVIDHVGAESNIGNTAASTTCW